MSKMKQFIGTGILLVLCGCQTTPHSPSLHISMVLQNNAQPFVSRQFAERLARLVIEEKYPGVFSVRGPGTILDKGELWWVTFENAAITTEDGSATSQIRAITRHLTVEIRKTNGEIVAIT